MTAGAADRQAAQAGECAPETGLAGAGADAPRAAPVTAPVTATPIAPATLYLVATPIGNLGDLSPRARDTLAAVDVMYAEDTRVTRKLSARFQLTTPLRRFDAATTARKIPEILARLDAGEAVALVSDAGTPGISDPGTPLVAAARDAGYDVVPVPGPSAAVAALSVSGLPTHAYYFGGFLPRKAGKRERLLTALGELDATLVFYESPYRVVASFQQLAQLWPTRMGAFARELTKLHEEIVRAPLPELAADLAARPSIRGEFVILIAPEPH
ncbi:MAG: 16S rRNA (cytidine(1402)-2'-O)-methyltransferase [Actinomycetes bacterium]|jgi:16S rRNA (cytidine1402-2'-O)-methyltransferase|nr:16S rRNA (cytidine(1402)-2'-O)-methyltransferase [Actinomycetes bacterium]